jgi:hypothetical protein
METKTILIRKILLVVSLFFLSLTISAQNYTINTIAGSGTPGFSGDGGSASNAKLNSPNGVAFDQHGHVLIVDHVNARVRKVDKNSGVITTIAGNGVAGFSGDGGPATAAQLNSPSGVHVVQNGHILIVDHANMRIRKVNPNTGIITTIAGNGMAGFSGDGGPATLARLNFPSGVCSDDAGNIFIADKGNGRVRKIDTNGNISTVAGGGLLGILGDGGLATLAFLNSPTGVAIDNNGHLLIVDHLNARVRKVNMNTGIITTIAGNGFLGFSGDGLLATLAQLNSPTHVFVHSNNHIHIVDQANMRIRKIDANTGIITTIVGNGVAGFSGDGGSALLASLNSPACAAINANDVIVIADMLNHRIRECVPSTCVTPSITVHPVNASACVGANASFSVVALGAGLNYQWQIDQGGGFVDLTNSGSHSGVTASTLVISNAAADLHSSRYRVKVTNSCGTVFSNAATLSVKAKPTITLSVGGVVCVETTICEGSSATIVAAGANTFLWSTGAITSNITVSPNTTTVYTVTGTDLNECSSTASITVRVNPKPNISISANPSSICPGGSSILTASGATSYQWNTGATTASISVSPTVTTTYSVVGTGSNGCTATASITITVKNPPNITVTASPSTICPGGSSTLSANGATSYVWSTGQTGPNIIVNPTVTTTYTVTGTKNGCSTTASVTVNVSSAINVTASASPSVICPGGSATLTASGATSFTWSTGQTGASIVVNPTTTTTYTVTGTSNGCSGSASVTVFVNEAVNVVASASPSTICPGGSATLTASGATNFTWSTGQTGASIIVNPSTTTTYTVTGTNAAGCSASASVTVFVNGSITVTASASPSTICPGGSASLTASGATNFTWSTGQTGASIVVNPSATTTYTVTGTNASGCSGTASVTVGVSASPNVTVVASPSVICTGGSATLTASGANNFTWSTGQTGASIVVNPNTTTTYSVTGTNAAGCSGTASVTVGVSASPNITVVASPSIICIGGSATLTASGASNFTWSTGQTGASIAVNPNATTTYFVTGTNAAGCSATASVTVFVNGSITVTASASPSTICPGGSATLTASGATNFTWSTGQTGASIVVNPTVATTYTVTGTNASGCSGVASVTVGVSASPNVTVVASPSVICPGGSATLTASGATNFTWSTGQTGATIVVNPTATTTYTVTGTNAAGCSRTASVTVSVSAPPNITVVASPSVICIGGSATLTASGASNFTWSTGQTGASIVVNPNATTTYFVTGTNSAGCSATASVTIFVNGSITVIASASPSAICIGGSATLTASGGTSYIWSTGQTGASIVVNPNTTTTYTVTGTNAAGCSGSASVTVGVSASPNVMVSASPSVICIGGSATLTASGASNFMWSTGQTGASIVVNPNTTTTYFVTGTNAAGCSSSASVTVFVNGSISVIASASPSTICAGGSSTLIASGANSYVWSTGQTGANIVVNPSVTTTYTVTGTSIGGCSASASVTVFVNGSISVSAFASPSTICPGGLATLTASGANNYVWSTGQTGASIVVSPSVTTTYFVTGTSAGGCSASSSVTVFVNGSINVTATASPSVICSGSSATLTASGANNYVWSTGQVGANIVVSPASTTTYTVTGTNTSGCSGVASVTVFVNPKPPVTCVANPSTVLLGLASTLTASGAVNYQWSTGAIGSSIIVIPLLTSTYSVTGTDANGCRNTAFVTVTVSLLPLLSVSGADDSADLGEAGEATETKLDEPSSITDKDLEKEISVYPNPSNGTFFVQDAPKKATIEIFNMKGARVFTSSVNNDVEEVTLDDKLAEGLFIIKIRSNNKILFQSRILKQ